MKQFRKIIKTFEETIVENSSDRVIILDEFRVPPGFRAIDFKLILAVKDGYSAGNILPATIFHTKEPNVSDLSAMPAISVPPHKLLTIKVEKPDTLQTDKLKMIIVYQQ